MKAEISAENFSVSPSGGEIPTITLQELEADPHGVFGAYRKKPCGDARDRRIFRAALFRC